MNSKPSSRAFLFAVGLALMSCGAASPARPKDPGSRVVVFKDGYAMVMRTFPVVTDGNGEVYIDRVPDAAVLGSFWATSTNGRIVSMHAGFTEVTERFKKKTGVVEHIEILAANVGRRAEIRYGDGMVFTGTIRAVLSRANEIRDPSDDAVVLETIAGHNFVLQTNDGDAVLSTSGIRSIVVDKIETELERAATRTEKKKRLTLRFEKANKPRTVTLTYFRPGIRWIPTYRLDLADDDAQLTLQAELINEAEDLTDLPIDIVVGVPNFRFKDTVSPLVLEARLKQAIAEVAPSLMAQSNRFTNASYGLRSTEHRRNSAAGDVSAPGELAGSLQHDLFVFSLPAMKLKKGERAAVRIFERRVPIRHLYTWDIQLKTSGAGRTPAGASPLVLEKNEVWHQIELENVTDVVWTTGAIMFLKDGRPLAQELLTYTSRGDRVRVPVTVSVETRGTAVDEETGRQLDALEWDRRKYVKISRRAKLSLCNHKADPIDVEIRMQVGGRASTASHDGKIALGPYRAQDWRNYRGSPVVNNSSTVTWKKTLTAGEVFEPTVEHHHFATH